MKKIGLIIVASLIMHCSCKAQREIIYTFDSSVIDSLKNGIKCYEVLMQRPKSKLKLYANMVEDDSSICIFLQEYSHLNKSGLLHLIKSTNRKIQIDNAIKIPVLIPLDRLSFQIKKDKVAGLPLGGYYVQFIYKNYRQIVVRTGELL